ncbi:MAG: hypothetical protein HRT74_11760, partial [Flavobacteriales bacterium]|nr:hypothetical protein [Flavobacteriales bacterium]
MREYLLRFFLFFFAIAMGFSTEAQRYGFVSWSTSDGLAQSQVRCLYQDHIGYLWIGTLGGVSRFDGRDFENFAKQDGLLNNQINAIAQLSNNEMVFGSIGGITTFNGQDFKAFPFPEGYSSAQVNHLQSTESGLLISTEKGLLDWDGSRFRSPLDIHLSQHKPLHVKKAWLVDGGGYLLCAKSGFYKITSKELIKLLDASELSAIFMDAEQVEDGSFLIATIGRGLLKWDGVSSSPEAHQFLGYGLNFTGLVSHEDETWMKSRDGLFRLTENDEVEVYGEKEGLATLDVRALLKDQEDNVWIGTNGAGIQKFPGRAFQSFSEEELIANHIVMDVQRDPGGVLWFSTYDAGVFSYSDQGLWSTYNVENSKLKNSRVWCSEVHKERMFFGSSGGLFYLENDKPVYFTKNDGLLANQILSLKSHGNKLMIGTSKGLCVLEEDGSLSTLPDFPRVKVRSIIPRGDTVLWLATNRGVYKVKGEEVIHYDESKGLADESVYCMESDSEVDLWIGTESGLNVLINDSLRPIKIPGGFGNNHINFIQFGAGKQVILGTNNGLLFAKDKSKALAGKEQWRRLGPHDGLIHLETNQNSAFLEGNKLFFGSSEAPMLLNLDQIKDESQIKSPKINISKVRINLEKPVWENYQGAVLDYGQRPSNLS